MENASNALLMAGGMLIFVIALTISIYIISQAKTTMDTVFYMGDKTNFYEYLGGDTDDTFRIVSWETVIPTLYKYYKENYTVVFLDEDGNGLELYTTKTNPDKWPAKKEIGTIPNILRKYYRTVNDDITVCSFDVFEEGARGEPWQSTGAAWLEGTDEVRDEHKENLNKFLGGGEYKNPTGTDNSRYVYGDRVYL